MKQLPPPTPCVYICRGQTPLSPASPSQRIKATKQEKKRKRKMTEKEMQSPYPVNGQANGDTEAVAAHDASELRRKKKRKCIIFIVVLIVSNVVINAIMAVTILKARNPKFRIRNATVTTFSGGAPTRLSLELSVKNTNFGRYKYPRATVVFVHQGVVVGTADVANSKVGWRSTKKIKLDVEFNLGNDLNATMYQITAQGKLRGRAEIMFMMKKRKGADLDCTMDIQRPTQQITAIACK